MHAHDRHFPMTTIYEKHPSPPTFSRLQAMAIAKSTSWADFVGGGHCPN
jgi:hypothetical protein